MPNNLDDDLDQAILTILLIFQAAKLHESDLAGSRSILRVSLIDRSLDTIMGLVQI